MIEFGAKLSLIDNMSATLQKNLEIQRRFTQQISQTNESVRALGRTRVNTSINATDNASGVLDVVREGLDVTSGMVASPELSPVDGASPILERVRAELEEMSSQVSSPELSPTDNASGVINTVRDGLESISDTVATPEISPVDEATEVIGRVRAGLDSLSTQGATPEVNLEDEATFIERERFDDPDKFIEYMQNDYDTWYEEGYGDSPAPPHIDPEFSYPNKKWAEIDGKEYYYNPILYESINILQHENGEWEIVVTTDEADQNGQAMYSILSAGLLSLHVINLAVCVVWYLVKTKKRKTA